MDKLWCILFVIIALGILCGCNKETFVPPVPDVPVVADMFTGEEEVAEYTDEEEEVAEYPDEVAEYPDEVAEYPDEEEEVGGFDEPEFELSMKKIE